VVKDQYFGDENDYKKYGLLRILAAEGAMRIAVCWMLTDGDQSNDGNATAYLHQPGKWRTLDPSLFGSLTRCVSAPENRSVDWAKDMDLIPGARYYDIPLRDSASAREVYFERFLTFSEQCHLAFFDPDVGLEIQSTPYGRKGSSRYLYEDELAETYDAGISVLVYQHFKRIERSYFLQTEASRLRALTGAAEIIAFCTTRVAFLLVPQPAHLAYLRERSEYVEGVWAPHITVVRHMESEKS
jgi:hypothetical protein